KQNTINKQNTIKIYKYFMNNSVPPNEIKTAMENSKVMKSINKHMSNIEHQQRIYDSNMTKKNFLRALQQTEVMFNTFGAIGTKLNSPAISIVAKVGALAMKMTTTAISCGNIAANFTSLGILSLATPFTLIGGLALGFMDL